MNSTTTSSDQKTETPAPATTPQPPPAPAPIVPANDDPSRMLSAFSSEQAFRAGYRMANALSRSSLMPKAYQGDENIPNVLIAMELANRIGASVFMVAQNLDIIHGRPGWRSQFLIATVNASNRFTPLRFRFDGRPGTDDYGCRAVAKDRASGEECLGALITIRMAKAEQWYQRSGSKWQTMPEQMLMYRSAAFWTRVYCPELALGIHTTEEVQDLVIDAEPVPQNTSTADLEANLRARPAPVAATPPANEPPPKRDFAAELDAIRGKLSKSYDAAGDENGRVPAAELANMRAVIDLFISEAPAEHHGAAKKYWEFLTGEKMP